jgi:putative peptidoglycan lipid II flippase
MPVTKLINQWKNFTLGSTNRKIFGAAITVATLTVFVKLISIIKELVVAWKFGTSDELDAFFIAQIIPFFVINIVAGSLSAALIPSYIQIQEKQGREASKRLLSGVVFLGIGLLLIATIIVIAASAIYLPLIAKGFDAQKLSLTFRLLYGVAPLILFSGIIIILGSVLNAGEKFALSAFTPTLTPVLIIFFLLGFESWGSFSLVAGLICGSALEMLLLGVALKRQNISFPFKWYGFTPELRQVVNQYSSTIAGSFLMCSAGLVDQSMAAMLAPGSVASLNYADKVIALPLFLTTTALNNAVTPYLSKMIARDEWEGVNDTLKKYLRLIFIVTIPLVLIFIFSSELIVKLLLERGSFTTQDTNLVAGIQSCYALQIPFYVGALFIVRLINALNKNYILIIGSAINLIANIAGNYLFMSLWGIKGIALSTSCVYLISFSFLLFFVQKYLISATKNIGTNL